jgi:hypothetical protein
MLLQYSTALIITKAALHYLSADAVAVLEEVGGWEVV